MFSETKTCKTCQQIFEITPDDQAFYEKIGVPEPTLCPDCRYQRRLANRNEWNFYKRNCSLCGKSMVSIHNPTYPGPVYCQPCYWSDKWDTLDYGRDFDFNRPFFEQFKEHRFTVPRIALTNTNSINSEYTNQANDNKNCYMCEASSFNEYCMYGNWIQNSRECVDCYQIIKNELLYESLYCRECYKCAYLDSCRQSNEIYFCKECVGCTNCFGCVNLRNKSNCWFNEQLSKEEYQKRFKEFLWTNDSIERMKSTFDQFLMRRPFKYYQGRNIVNSTGDCISNSKNCKYGFNVRISENTAYSQDAWEARNCMDLTETEDNELDYECEGTGWGQRNISVSKKWWGSDVYYSELTFHSDNIFGCVSIIKKNYCIFNKQYTPEAWKEMKDRIVTHMKKTGEWGEFFPATISPFPYNDTVANDYFPMTKGQVLAKGWRWHDKPRNEYQIGGDILACRNKDNNCVGVGAFRLHPTEIEFYQKMNLPTPQYCFPCRLKARLARRNPRKLWKRNCMKCGKDIQTSYAPERPEIVYCEQCYNAEIL